MGEELRGRLRFLRYVPLSSAVVEVETDVNSATGVAHLRVSNTVISMVLSFLWWKAFTKRVYGMNAIPLFQASTVTDPKRILTSHQSRPILITMKPSPGMKRRGIAPF